MALLNFKFGSQSGLPSTKAPGTVYITKDTKKLFVDNPTDGSTERICLGDFQLVSWTKSESVKNPNTALSNYSLKDANTLYITVESATGATAMWRYSGSEFKAISNSEEIADIVADVSALQTQTSILEQKVIHYGTCSTPSLTKNKIVDCENFTLYKGALISVYMENASSAELPTLNVNGTGAYPITVENGWQLGAAHIGHWKQHTIVTFVYDGEDWKFIDEDVLSKIHSVKQTADAAMPKAGGTFTGAITVPAPTANGHATTKQYVDSAVGTINTNISNINKDLKDNYMPKKGGTFTGEVNFADGIALIVNEPSADGHAANKKYVDDTASAALQEITGVINGVKSDILGKKDDSDADFEGTVKGAYDAASEAATAAANAQKEVDALEGVVAGKAPTNHASTTTTYGTGSSTNYGHVKLSDATNVTSANGGAATGVAASAYAVKLAYDRGSAGVTAAGAAQTTADAAATTAANAMPKAGGTFTGNVTMGANKTLIVNAPTAGSNQAATAKYVDDAKTGAESTAQGYVNAAKTAILGTNDDGSNYVGTVKGAYGAASTASTAAQNAQDKADQAYTLAGQKTTTAEVKAQIEKYGYATTAVAQSKADAALNSAKSYTDGKISTVNTTINTLKSDIGNLSNIMNFLGATTTPLSNGSTTSKITIDSKEVTAVKGDVVINGNKEFVFDGSKWAEIGDVSAQSTAIDGLLERIGNAESDIDNLQADVGTNDNKGALFTRVAALETWKDTHATDYNNLEGRVDTLESWKTTHTNAYNTLNNTVSGHTAAIGAANDSASATGSLYARIKQNYNDINTASTGLKARVGALESWKGTHTTAFNTLSETVTKNGKTINDLIAVLQWGSF